jgi:Lrp/AsnC family leucine-responsive transcriptional regulator
MHTEIPAPLDELDLRLLSALQRNGRSTYADLAMHVGLKTSAVHDRVKRLEQRGFVKGYGARIDTRRVGLGLVAFISAYIAPDGDYDDFVRAVSDLPEVCEIHSVAGEETYIIKAITRSTEHLDDFLGRIKSIRGVARSKTTVVLGTPFEREGIAVEQLQPPPQQAAAPRLRAL